MARKNTRRKGKPKRGSLAPSSETEVLKSRGAATASHSLFRPVNLGSVLFISALVCLCYLNTLGNDFVHDDRIEILQNPYIQNPSNYSKIFTTASWAFYQDDRGPVGSNYYRPMQYLAYALLYSLFGPASWAFHLTKVVLHLSVCLLLYGMIKAHWDDEVWALVSSLFFAAHPVNTEAVTWIAGITDVSCALFFLLAFWCLLQLNRSDSLLWLAGCCSLFFLGLLSKETMVTFVPLALFYDWTRSGELPGLRRLVRIYLPLCLSFGLYLLLRISAIGALTHPGQVRFDFLDGFQALLSQLWLLSQYLLITLLPLQLNAYRIFDPVLTLTDIRLPLSLAVLGGLVALAAWAFKGVSHDRRQPMLLGLAWFLFTLSPVLIFFKRIGENVLAERYLYLPSLGLSLSLGVVFAFLYRHYPKTIYIGFSILLLLLSWKVISRNFVWRNDVIFYETTARSSPASALIMNNLGTAYDQKGRQREALQAFERSVAIKPNLAAYKNLARIYGGLKRMDDAVRAYERAAALDPNDSGVSSGLGDLYFYLKRYPEAIQAYGRALELRPSDLRLHYNLADTYMLLREYDQARSAFEVALSLSSPGQKSRAERGIQSATAALNAESGVEAPAILRE